MKPLLRALWVSALLLATPSFGKVKKPYQKAIQLSQGAIVDGHNDLPWTLRQAGFSDLKIDLKKKQPQFHTDIPRLRQGGVGLQFWSAYVPASSREKGNSVELTLEQIDLIRRMVQQYPQDFTLAKTAQEARDAINRGKIASMIGVEGGYSIGQSLGVLRGFYDLGVRYMTLTHSKTIEWADSATDVEKHGGLTEFGRRVVREMNKIGMLVDISHVSPKVMKDVLAVSKAPVIASHSSALAVADHVRNVPDEILRRVKTNGGVVMINFYSAYVNPASVDYWDRYKAFRKKLSATVKDPKEMDKVMKKWRLDHPMAKGNVEMVLDHIEHVVKVAGIDHVGLGSDYDGVGVLPEGLEDVSTYPVLTQGLLDRGYGEDDILKILGGNAFRALEVAEQVSRKLRLESH